MSSTFKNGFACVCKCFGCIYLNIYFSAVLATRLLDGPSTVDENLPNIRSLLCNGSVFNICRNYNLLLCAIYMQPHLAVVVTFRIYMF